MPRAADRQRTPAVAAGRSIQLPELPAHPGAGLRGSPTLKVLRVYTDGAARGNPGPAGLGVVIEDEAGLRLRGLCRFIGTATNNVAEYLALIEGLTAVADWKPDKLEVFLDSKLVVEQVNGNYKVKNAALQPLAARATSLLAAFPDVVVAYVPREKNKGADALANKGIDDWVNARKRG